MKKLLINVFAFIGLAFIAGLLYWIGFFRGAIVQTQTFHEQCKRVSIITFDGDSRPYLCTPPPQEKKGPAMQFGSVQKEKK